jgi:hypothetical protein
MQTVSWLVSCGCSPWLYGGMYPSAIAHRLAPMMFTVFLHNESSDTLASAHHP